MILPSWYSKISLLVMICLMGLAGILLFLLHGILNGWPLYLEQTIGDGENQTQFEDVANWVTLTIEFGVGILIALIVYVITYFQQEQSKKILDKLNFRFQLDEIRIISQILGGVNIAVRILDNIQQEIVQRRVARDIHSDDRLFRSREIIRNICRNLRDVDIVDLHSLEIERQLNWTLTGLEIFVEDFDEDWDVLDSNIYDDIGELLDLLILHVGLLQNNN